MSKTIKPGDWADESRIYRCSNCGNVTAFISGEKLPSCEICLTNGDKHVWNKTSKRIVVVSKNVRKEFDKKSSSVDKVADRIARFFGSMEFVYIHIFWFGSWLLVNMGMVPRVEIFDAFPFGLLTLIVSLEAIILTTFILISQNRQSERMEVITDLDFQTDLKVEKELAEIKEIVKSMDNNKKINKK